MPRWLLEARRGKALIARPLKVIILVIGAAAGEATKPRKATKRRRVAVAGQDGRRWSSSG